MGMQTVENYRELKQEVKKCDCINQLFGNHFLVHLYIVRSIPKRARKSITTWGNQAVEDLPFFFWLSQHSITIRIPNRKVVSYRYRSTFCQMCPTLTRQELSFIQVSCVGFVAPKLINWGCGSRHQRPASLPQSLKCWATKSYQNIRGFLSLEFTWPYLTSASDSRHFSLHQMPSKNRMLKALFHPRMLGGPSWH